VSILCGQLMNVKHGVQGACNNNSIVGCSWQHLCWCPLCSHLPAIVPGVPGVDMLCSIPPWPCAAAGSTAAGESIADAAMDAAAVNATVRLATCLASCCSVAGSLLLLLLLLLLLTLLLLLLLVLLPRPWLTAHQHRLTAGGCCTGSLCESCPGPAWGLRCVCLLLFSSICKQT
jgi:hypothetical protein